MPWFGEKTKTHTKECSRVIKVSMRIGIVGTGISGLVCARLLNRENDISVFEAGSYIGGHTHTIDVQEGTGTRPVDTGFIVFNEKTYPNLVEIFDRLGVESRESNMSFSVFNPDSGFEYNATDLKGLLARPSNLLRKRFWNMIRGILRFYKMAPELLGTLDEDVTLGTWLDENRFPKAFIDDHLMPMASAVWSTPLDQIRDYPLLSLIRFFDNHGFLQLSDRPVWRTVVGGSSAYIDPMTAPFRDKIRLNCPVQSINRSGAEVLLTTASGEEHIFDRVILACHGDQALRLLGDSTEKETEILSCFRYSTNPTTLHHDSRWLPSAPKARAAWNVRTSDHHQDIQVNYWMNSLQGFNDAPVDYVVTLNDQSVGTDVQIDPDCIIAKMVYEHPLFNNSAISAQNRHHEIDGIAGVHFCGAYWANGFHEDGVTSALRVAKKFNRNREEFSHGI